MRAKLAVGMAAAAAAAASLATPAFAGSATVSPNSNLHNGDAVTVTYTGYTPGTQLFVMQCFAADSPTFNYVNDCSNLSTISYPSIAAADGSVSFNVFAGDSPDPDADKGCGTPATPTPGITYFPTCYIRVTDTAPSNNAVDDFKPITFAQTDVAETPYTPLLLLGGAAVVGGGLFLNRKRRLAA